MSNEIIFKNADDPGRPLHVRRRDDGSVALWMGTDLLTATRINLSADAAQTLAAIVKGER